MDILWITLNCMGITLPKLAPFVDDPGSRCFVQFDGGQFWERRFELVPEPDGNLFTRGVFETGYIVHAFVIEQGHYRFHHLLQNGKVHHPAQNWIWLVVNPYFQSVGMTVHVFAFVIFGHVGKKVSGIESELFENTHKSK